MAILNTQKVALICVLLSGLVAFAVEAQKRPHPLPMAYGNQTHRIGPSSNPIKGLIWEDVGEASRVLVSTSLNVINKLLKDQPIYPGQQCQVLFDGNPLRGTMIRFPAYREGDYCRPYISNFHIATWGGPGGSAGTFWACELNETTWPCCRFDPRGCAKDPSTFKFELNTDRPGENFRNFTLQDVEPSSCAQACVDETSCRAWTYVKPGVQGASAHCWLKTQVTAATTSDCCVSGVKKSAVIAAGDLSGQWGATDGSVLRFEREENIYVGYTVKLTETDQENGYGIGDKFIEITPLENNRLSAQVRKKWFENGAQQIEWMPLDLEVKGDTIFFGEYALWTRVR